MNESDPVIGFVRQCREVGSFLLSKAPNPRKQLDRAVDKLPPVEEALNTALETA